MQTPSILFVPKYTPGAYIWLAIYIAGFVLLMTSPFIRNALYPGEETWVGFYWGIAFGLAALYEGGKLIRAIEFGDDGMVLDRYLRGRKSIPYREIKRIILEWSYIDAKGAKIYFHDMTNQDEMLTTLTQVLSAKNLANLSLEEAQKKVRAVVFKRLRYALIFTAAVGLLAEFVGHADWSSFSIILLLYFVLAYQVLRLFIK